MRDGAELVADVIGDRHLNEWGRYTGGAEVSSERKALKINAEMERA
jgi:hypothetical protein